MEPFVNRWNMRNGRHRDRWPIDWVSYCNWNKKKERKNEFVLGKCAVVVVHHGDPFHLSAAAACLFRVLLFFFSSDGCCCFAARITLEKALLSSCRAADRVNIADVICPISGCCCVRLFFFSLTSFSSIWFQRVMTIALKRHPPFYRAVTQCVVGEKMRKGNAADIIASTVEGANSQRRFDYI